MKIETLKISNFRGIKEITLESLGNIVVIAGQNGSGKSCIFDAIRLLKSIYGGYQANEWQQWMGEFQIRLTNRPSDIVSIFNKSSKELHITCEFRLSKHERQYIDSHADELLREKIWRILFPETYNFGGDRMTMFAAQMRDREPEVSERAKAEYSKLKEELAAPTLHGEFHIRPEGTIKTEESIALSVIFSTFRPIDIGVIDHHGAQRHYGREVIQGINLNLEEHEQQRSQWALYNHANKYNNVKGEMAASYIKEILIAQASGIPREQQPSLTNTLQELFATFFPEKRFLGPQATESGALSFPVETEDGSRYDLDELSSGEKEILYGYLRIRNSAPRHSIILIDEPELHLNPRLIRNLPEFYRKNLGEVLNNQIWLVTHSDTLLREVVGKENYNVFHMLPCRNVGNDESQLKPLGMTDDLNLALIDLVGDLALYQPSGKIIIFEGGGDSDFDQRVVSTLFPELQERANLISGTNKTRVRALHELLEKASEKGNLPFKFFSITDKDMETTSSSQSQNNSFLWDVYHIENYFLEARFIEKALSDLQGRKFLSEKTILEKLKQCALNTVSHLIQHELTVFVNNTLVQAIDTKTDPNAKDAPSAIFGAINRSVDRINKLHKGELNQEHLKSKKEDLHRKYTESFDDGTWISKVRGRDVLKSFVNEHGGGISYEFFRNLILSSMKDSGYKPPGMKQVIDQILSR